MNCLPSILTENEYLAIIISMFVQKISDISVPEDQKTINIRRSSGSIESAILVPFTITSWLAVNHKSKICRDGILVFRMVSVKLSDNKGYKDITTLDMVELNIDFVMKKIKENPLSDEYRKIYCERLVSEFGIDMYPLLVAYENGKIY